MDNHTEAGFSESPLPNNSSTAEPAPSDTPLTADARDSIVVPLPPVQPRLRPSVTIICAVLFVVSIGATALASWLGDRANLLEAPEEFLEHVFGRNLDLEAYVERRSDFEKLVDKLQGYEPGDFLDEAIGAYAEYAP